MSVRIVFFGPDAYLDNVKEVVEVAVRSINDVFGDGVVKFSSVWPATETGISHTDLKECDIVIVAFITDDWECKTKVLLMSQLCESTVDFIVLHNHNDDASIFNTYNLDSALCVDVSDTQRRDVLISASIATAVRDVMTRHGKSQLRQIISRIWSGICCAWLRIWNTCRRTRSTTLQKRDITVTLQEPTTSSYLDHREASRNILSFKLKSNNDRHIINEQRISSSSLSSWGESFDSVSQCGDGVSQCGDDDVKEEYNSDDVLIYEDVENLYLQPVTRID